MRLATMDRLWPMIVNPEASYELPALVFSESEIIEAEMTAMLRPLISNGLIPKREKC